MVAILVFIFLFGYFQQSANIDAIIDYKPKRARQITRRVIGSILVIIGILGSIISLLLFFLQDFGMLPENSSNLDIQAGFFMFFIVWGSYICNFIPSDIVTWQKTCKAIGYTLLCIAFYLPCFIPSYVLEYHAGIDSDQIILYICLIFAMLLPISIFLIRLSRKREPKNIISEGIKQYKDTTPSKQDKTDLPSRSYNFTESISINKDNQEKINYTQSNKIRSFQQKINLILFIVSGIFLIVSIIFFIVYLCAYHDEELYCCLWLIFSLMSSVALSVWYYLNQNCIVTQNMKIYGVTFITSTFIFSISPFYAIVSLIIGTRCTKHVFDNENNGNG